MDDSVATPPEKSQRDRLLGRPRPSSTHRLLVDPDAEPEARAELARVQREVRKVMQRDSSTQQDKEAATQRQEQAEAKLNACFETIILRALPPRRVEELEAAHPPTADQLARAKSERDQAQQRGEQSPEWPSWNEETFWPELLSEVVDNDMTTDDWTAFLSENVSSGERRSLQLAALQVNLQERAADPVVIPKGLMTTLNSALS